MTANHFDRSAVTPAQILEGVSAIALQIQQSVALEPILQSALETTRALLHSDRVLLYRFLPDGNGIVTFEAAATEWLPLLGQIIDDPCLKILRRGRYQQGYVSLIEDVTASSIPVCYAALLNRLQVKANLVVPLFAQGEVCGLLIAHHCQSARSWQPLEVQCLQMVAVQLGVAIQLANRLQEQLVGAIATRLPGAIYRAVYSPEGISSLFLSESYHTLLGYEPQALMAHPDSLFDLIHPDDRTCFVEALNAAAQKPDANFYLEYRLITAAGAALWVKDHARFSRSESGDLIMDGMHLDISDRKRSEAVLRESEAHKTALLSALPDLVMRADKNGIYLEFLATKTFRVIGKTGDFVGTHVNDSLPPELAQRRMDTISLALATNAIQFYEQVIMVNGAIQTEEVRVVPYRVDEVLLLVRDISDRKQAEMALLQRAEQEQAMNRVVRAIRQSLDLQTILTTAATEIAQLLNIDQAAVVQYLPERQCWLHVATYQQKTDQQKTEANYLGLELGLEIPDQDNPFAAQLKRREIVKVVNAAAIKDEINQNLAQKLPGSWLLVPIIVGDTVWGSFSLLSSQTIEDWQEEQVEVVQALADQLAIAIQQAALYQQVQTLNADLELQVQKRTAQLQQALNFEALLKRITDQVRDSLDETQILQTAVQELTVELGVDCCNAALYDMEHRTSTICYESVQAQMSTGTGKVVLFDQYPELYHQVLRGQIVHCCITASIVESHRNIEQNASVLICPLMDENGVLGDMWLFNPKHVCFNELEIRLVQQVANQCAIALRQSRLYQAAQAQVEELERLNQLKDDFLSTVSHELRTPMANIKMATQMLELSLKPLGFFESETNPINRYFNILRDEGQREIGLINDLLDLARLDAGVEPLHLTTIAPQVFLRHLAEPFLERTRKQQQQLVIQLPDTLPLLTTDLSYLERILTELLQNACKYTPIGETITLVAQTNQTALEICVSNSGVEIPAIECDRIFDKFYRIPNNDPWKHGGTGLGLTLVKKLAEYLGASIRVASRNQQTTFTLEFLGVT